MRTSLLRQAISQISGDACTTFAGVPGLFEPKDWSKLAQAAVERCTGLLNKVTTSVPSSETVLDLDEMSDVLCQVLDAAEFCRNVHSDASWRSAAEQTCVKLSGFVHELNTNFALYTALKSAILGTSKTINGSSSWDSETRLVARMLLRDFERYGVHLEGTTRDTMTNLVAQHQLVGYEFGHNAADPKFCGQLTLQGASARRISQLPSALQKVFSGTRHGSKAGILTAPGQSSTLFGIMAFAEEESLRKAAYDLYNSTPSNNRSLLARLLEIRQEIANIMGYPSYAAYQLHGASLAGNPSAVTEFLQRLSKDSNEKAAEEIEELRVSVMQSGKDLVEKSTMFPGRLAAWDKDWSINKAMNNSREMDRLAILNNGLFTLDGCLAAMNEVFSKTMGIVLREVEPQRNETWARGVRKLLVESKLDGFLGCIYFDPFRRSRKFPGAAHFTLRCGRAARGTGSYQTPVVAVVTNFHSLDSTLSFSDVETIFHEFGHALNSVLSRTRFQHLSGTRGSQDIVEIPSHVFERFASIPEVVSLSVKHSSGNHAVTTLPSEVFTSAMACKRQFSAIKLQSQVIMAALDQYVHGEQCTSSELGRLEERIAVVAEDHSLLHFGEHYQPLLRFQHLVTYGGMYYCYLFAQCISASVWERELRSNFLTETTMGEQNSLFQRLLEPGGAKEPIEYVSGLWEHSINSLMTSGSGGCYPNNLSLLRYLGIKT